MSEYVVTGRHPYAGALVKLAPGRAPGSFQGRAVAGVFLVQCIDRRGRRFYARPEVLVGLDAVQRAADARAQGAAGMSAIRRPKWFSREPQHVRSLS